MYLASVFLDCGGGGGSGRAGGGGGSLESLLQELVLEDFKSIPVFFDEEVGDDVGVCSPLGESGGGGGKSSSSKSSS